MTTTRLFEYRSHWLNRRHTSPHFYINWHEKGSRRTRRRTTGTSNYELATGRLVEFAERNLARSGIRPGTIHDVSRSTNVVAFLQDYVGSLRDAKVSYRRAVVALEHWAKFCQCHHIACYSELTLQRQEQYIRERRNCHPRRRGASLSNGTLIRELGVLKAAMHFAWKHGKIPFVPYVLSLPSPRPRQRFLTVTEVHRLLAECHAPHLRLYVLIALHTLQRPSAIRDLQIGQIDFASNRIDFLPPDRKQTRKGRPVVPITVTLRPHLESAVRESKTGYLVEYRGVRLRGNLRKSFSKACARANLPGVTPYTLRHTGATLLAAAGVPMRQIAGMMGHTTERMTELYAKHSPEFLAEAVLALDGVFGHSDLGASSCLLAA